MRNFGERLQEFAVFLMLAMILFGTGQTRIKAQDANQPTDEKRVPGVLDKLPLRALTVRAAIDPEFKFYPDWENLVRNGIAKAGKAYQKNFGIQIQLLEIVAGIAMPFGRELFVIPGRISEFVNGERLERDDFIAEVLAHELGHLFGAWHSRYFFSAMHPHPVPTAGEIRFDDVSAEVIAIQRNFNFIEGVGMIAPEIKQKIEKIFMKDSPEEESPFTLSSVNAAVRLLAEKRYSDALAQFRQIQAQHPEMKSTYLYTGIVLFRQSKFLEAADEFTVALKTSPKSIQVHLYLGRIFTRLDRWPDAEKEFRKVEALRPDSPEMKQLIGEVYLEGKKYREAIKWLVESLQLDPQRGISHYELAWALYGTGSYRIAWREVHRAQKNGYKVPVNLIDALEHWENDPGDE